MARHKKVRIVLVGCGSMANAWVKHTLDAPDAQLVGLVDVRRPAAEAMAQRHNLPPELVYDSLKAALAATKPDAVFDVTIPEAHAPVTIEALRAGCHVLGEKPMSDSMASAKKMVAAAKKAGKLYAVTQTRRPVGPVMSVERFLRSGRLGAVEEVHCDFFLGCHFGGFRDQMADVLLLDMAIHTFDKARMFTRADPVAVYCRSFNPKRSWYRGDASAVAIFEMKGPRNSDIVYTYRGSWCAEGLQTSWQSQWRFVCSKGTLLWDGEDNMRAAAIDPQGKHAFHSQMVEAPVERVRLDKQGHQYLIHEFIECVRSGGRRKPMCPCEDNIKSLAMVLAAVKSAHSGRRKRVSV